MEVVLGLDFGGTKIALAICGLDGRGLVQQVLVTNPGAGGDAVLERGISAGRALLALSGEHYDLVSVGVSTIGIPRQDRVELAPAIPGWEHVGLAHAVTAAFGVPVRVVTDVKAAATAEARWGALAGSDPAIYLNLGTGLAAAILVGGRVLDGAHGASGEIGYNVVAPGDAARGIAARPMLEHTVSGMALAAHGSRPWGARSPPSRSSRPPTPTSSWTLWSAPWSKSSALIWSTSSSPSTRTGSPSAAGWWRSWGRIRGPLEHALSCSVPFPPELVLANYPFDAPLVGALALGAEAAGASWAGGPVFPQEKAEARRPL